VATVDRPVASTKKKITPKANRKGASPAAKTPKAKPKKARTRTPKHKCTKHQHQRDKDMHQLSDEQLLEVKRRFDLIAFGIDNEGNRVQTKPVHYQTNKKKHPDCKEGRHNSKTPTVERYNLIVKLLQLKKEGKEDELESLKKEVSTKVYNSMNKFFLSTCIDPETKKEVVELRRCQGEQEVEVEDEESPPSPNGTV
jgi:hypothetical protein